MQNYRKLEKYLPYCTRHCAITSTYWSLRNGIHFSITTKIISQTQYCWRWNLDSSHCFIAFIASLSKFLIVYIFTKASFVNYVLFFNNYFCILQSIFQISKVMDFTLNISIPWYYILISVMRIDHNLWYARIGVFQSAKFKFLSKVYTDPSVNLGNQEVSIFYWSICSLLLICASNILNVIVNNFEKFKSPIFFKCWKNAISVIH